MKCVFSSSLLVASCLLGGCASVDEPRVFNHAALTLAPSRIVVEKEGGVIASNGVIHVPANEEWVYSEAVEFQTFGAIIVDGVIRGLPPESSLTPAPTMTLSSATGIIIRGEVHGFPGADGSYGGANGGDAGAMIVRAPVLVLNSPLIAPRGGAGFPDDGRYTNRKSPGDEGRGGTGGRLEVYAQVIGPYDENGDYVTGFANAIGGPGGHGGGNGGNAMSGLFRETPWMVQYREYYLLTDAEIEAARARGEIR